MHRSLFIGIALLCTACARVETGPIVSSGQQYVSEEGGFHFAVPEGVEVNVQDRHTATGFVLSVIETPVEDLDQPLGHDKETAMANQKALAQGQFGPRIDFMLPASAKVVRLDTTLNGKVFAVFGRFEVCDMTFERMLTFYRNGRQIFFVLQAPLEPMMDDLHRYFSTDPQNCMNVETGENQLVWEEGGMEAFYASLEGRSAPLLALQWFDTFDAIVASIKLD